MPNQVRNLAEVVTLEAWHDKFDGATARADLHVNVAFSTGRIGRKATDKVRFRLMLRQAEVVIVIPTSEPAEVDPRSVRRDARAREGVATQTRETDLQGSANAGAKLKLGASGAAAGLDLGVSAAASLSPPLARFSRLGRRFSRLSRSASISSVSTISASRTGSTEPETCVTSPSSKQRSTWATASTSRMWPRN